MKVKLHNKIEIIQGTQTCVLYNTMLKSVYSAIAEVKDYFSRIALGTGQGESVFSNTTLEGFVSSHELETEEVCCDISADELFVKKSITFGENECNGLVFSEMGITDDSGDNPIIYNRVVVKNSDGEPLVVTKRDGEALTIRITLYLIVAEDSKKYFTLGDNPLLLQMMGEKAADDKNIYAIRGTEYLDFDKSVKRTVPKGNQTKCTLEQNGDPETGFSFDIIASLGNGDAREVVFVYGEKAVMRVDISSFGKTATSSLALSFDEKGFVNIGKENVLSVNSITNSSNGSEILPSEIEQFQIAHRCGEGVKKVPIFTTYVPSDASDIMLSPDGKSFTLGLASNTFNGVYTANKDGITCVSSTSVHDTDYRMVRLYKGALYFFNTASDNFGFYDVVNSGNGERQIDSTDMKKSYDFSTITDFDCFISSNGHLLIGMVLSLASQKTIGVVGVYEEDTETGGYVFTKAIETSIDGVGKVKAYPAEFGGEGKMIFFAKNNESSQSAFECELISENESEILADKTVAEFAFRDSIIGINVAKDLLLFKLGDPAYNGMVVYDITRKCYTGYQACFQFEKNVDVSPNGKYFVEYKTDSHEYVRLLYRNYYDDICEFEDSSKIITSDVKKVILTNDLIILLKYDTNAGTYYFEAYRYDETYSVLHSEDNTNLSALGEIVNVDPLGDGEFEGVEVKFSLHLTPPVSEE